MKPLLSLPFPLCVLFSQSSLTYVWHQVKIKALSKGNWWKISSKDLFYLFSSSWISIVANAINPFFPFIAPAFCMAYSCLFYCFSNICICLINKRTILKPVFITNSSILGNQIELFPSQICPEQRLNPGSSAHKKKLSSLG